MRFYKAFPKILDSVSTKSVPLLSWTHYRVLLQVEDEKARTWYEKEAINQYPVTFYYMFYLFLILYNKPQI